LNKQNLAQEIETGSVVFVPAHNHSLNKQNLAQEIETLANISLLSSNLSSLNKQNLAQEIETGIPMDDAKAAVEA